MEKCRRVSLVVCYCTYLQMKSCGVFRFRETETSRDRGGRLWASMMLYVCFLEMGRKPVCGVAILSSLYSEPVVL